MKQYRYTEKGIAYSNTRLYKIWSSMKSRCSTPSHTSYKNYGAKGITVCEEWARDFGAFREWAIEAGYDEEAPRGQYTLERIDVKGPYSPENCCWKTIQEQERNKNTTIYVEDNGERICLKEYCERYGANYGTEKYRQSEANRKYAKERKKQQRRAKGMRSREEYAEEQAAKTRITINRIKEAMKKNPGASIRQLAAITGLSKSTVGHLKKKALTEEVHHERL